MATTIMMGDNNDNPDDLIFSSRKPREATLFYITSLLFVVSLVLVYKWYMG